ncbi:unnamed protein product [Oppiella nova]|uniref:Uncharacterized protein n=1 Tax=Oppiella nova TaxID=334625 RepID=A0A7R9QMV7_9ACAR|nr:unnamed protein product [Oppiella nova]CAG2169085.1 unnamed protein product [Oppiella nova]
MGAGTAVHFAKLGAKVVVNGRDAKRVAAVAHECRQVAKTSANVLAVVADLQDDKHVKDLVLKTIDTFGKIDILVNCAGIVGRSGVMDPEYQQLFDRIVRVNLRSVVSLISLVVPYLEASKGCIVNVSSISAQTPWRRSWTAYGLTKCALDNLTKCMAMELGPKGIRVNSILPGIILTPMIGESSFSDEQAIMYCESMYPLKRPGYVEDIVKVIDFLASDNSSFITGISIPIDGGSIVGPRVALITGSSAGVGKKFALSLAKVGFKLVITGRDEKKIKEVAEECRQLSKEKVLEIKADLLNDTEVEKLIQKTIEEFGRLDVLANCVQITVPCSISDANIMDTFERVFNTNVRSLVVITRLAIPHLLSTKGAVLTLTSDSGLLPYESEFPFCVSESAVDYFTKGLASDMKRQGITVLSLNSSLVMSSEFERNPWFSTALCSRL